MSKMTDTSEKGLEALIVQRLTSAKEVGLDLDAGLNEGDLESGDDSVLAEEREN